MQTYKELVSRRDAGERSAALAAAFAAIGELGAATEIATGESRFNPAPIGPALPSKDVTATVEFSRWGEGNTLFTGNAHLRVFDGIEGFAIVLRSPQGAQFSMDGRLEPVSIVALVQS